MKNRTIVSAFFALVCLSPLACNDENDSPTPASADGQHPAIARAMANIAAAPQTAVADGDHTFAVADVIADADGREHVRMRRFYKGLPVLGGDVVVHGRDDGMLEGVSHEMRGRKMSPSLTPTLAALEAEARAMAEFKGRDGVAREPELKLDQRDGDTRLGYEIVVDGFAADETPSEFHAVVDAHNGEIIDHWDGIETTVATGTGKSFFNGTLPLTTNSNAGTFELRDPGRGDQFTTDMHNKQSGTGMMFTDLDNVWGDFTRGNRATVAVDAQFGTAMTWDYYLKVHKRRGIANNGKGAFNRVHYGRNYNNAFWSDACFCMTYGDGDGVTLNPFASLDVAGHEMTHGMTARTAGLVYSGESGGLNEATSDIFGTMVEWHTNNPYDPPDYLIGEKLFKTAGKALRYMYKPSLDGRSVDCWSPSVGTLDVHYSSGVGNHFFYLLAEGSDTKGPVCKGSTVTSVKGVGRAAAAKIYYRALTVYMTSRTNYAGARLATLKAATDLFGAGSTERTAVATAWSGVRVD